MIFFFNQNFVDILLIPPWKLRLCYSFKYFAEGFLMSIQNTGGFHGKIKENI